MVVTDGDPVDVSESDDDALVVTVDVGDADPELDWVDV